MKNAETKTTSSHLQRQTQQEAQPFFGKDGEATFFSEASNDIQTQPFFSPDSHNRTAYHSNGMPFFSPTIIQTQPISTARQLTIGQPNDKYEQEADAMADKVMTKLAQPENTSTDPASTAVGNTTTAIQPKCATCGAEEKLQKKEDENETEELSLKEESIQRKPIFKSNEDPLDNNTIQRKCAACAEKEQIQKMELPEEEAVQQKSETDDFTASPDLESQLNASKGGGSPLPKETASSMGEAMGTDFSGVQVHTGADAVQMNQGLGAQAFTHGSDIYFNEGKYDTNSSSGKHLLAHELVHTVQQRGSIAPKIQKQSKEKEDRTVLNKSEFPWRGKIDTKGNLDVGFHTKPWASSPEEDNPIYPSLVNGETVYVLGVGKDNWLHIKRSNNGKYQTGYVDWRYVKENLASYEEFLYYVSKLLKDNGLDIYWFDSYSEFKIRVLDEKEIYHYFLLDYFLYGIYQDMKGIDSGTTESKAAAKKLMELLDIDEFKGNYMEARELYFTLIDRYIQSIDKAIEELDRISEELKNLSDPRMQARDKLIESQERLFRIQELLKNENLPEQNKLELQDSATKLITEIVGLKELLEKGETRREHQKAIGGTLLAGLALPLPEEVVTWPASAIYFIILLMFTARAAKNSDIARAVSNIASLLSEAMLVEEAATEALEGIEEAQTTEDDVKAQEIVDELLKDLQIPKEGENPKNEPDPVIPLIPSKPKEEDSECIFTPAKRHLGGDEIHDTCADLVPPNIYPGRDVNVKIPSLGLEKNFDAESPSKELWEVKTNHYSKQPPFIKEKILEENMEKDIKKELPIATKCKRPYVFAVSDQEHYNDLGEIIPDGVDLRLVNCL